MDRPALTPQQQLHLLEQARSQQGLRRERALQELLGDFRPLALAVIQRTLASMGLGAEHAEEAFQQAVFRFLHAGLQRFRGDSAPRTYFTRMAINAALDLGRAAAARAALEGEAAAPPWVARPGQTAAPDRLVSARQVRLRLDRCLEQLRQPYRQAVQLYYLEELGDCGRCAQEQGVGKEAFMKRLSRARTLLARCIGEQE